MRILIVVDVQNDFTPGGALAVPEGDQVLPVVNRVMDKFDRVVATQDWHPSDHGSFAVNHPGRKPGDVVMLDGIEQILWPVHCVQGTPGATFRAGLNTERFEKVFYKGTNPGIDSYSCFYDNGHRKDTGLGDYLRNSDVTDVYIMGLATDYCVKSSALDAVRFGFNTYVIIDGCRGVELNEGDVDRAVEEMKAAGVAIVNSSDLL